MNLSREVSRTVEVNLQDERGYPLQFSFKKPGWDNLAASANRLLKFEFPVVREIKVYERLIKTNVLSTGLSKKALDALPLPALERIYVQLWRAWFGENPSLADQWLCLFLLAEDMAGFQLETLVQEDIKQLGLRDTGAMHSYYYQGALNPQQMVTLLTRHGYHTGYFTPNSPGAKTYLACRRLSSPLPWAVLLEQLTPAELIRYPRLAYLKAIHAKLCEKGWNQEAITPETLPRQLDKLSQWLHHKDFSKIGATYHQARPVKTLVIVEGETEKLLLPVFSQAMSLNFDHLGIHILPAGGKNHVLSIYRQQATVLNCPIFVVLDQDAQAIGDEIRTDFRKGDYIFTIQEGEFEDLYDLPLVLKTINQNYQPYPEITEYGFRDLATQSYAKGRVQTLKALWQAYNLGSFDKIDFAMKYAEAFQQGTAGTEHYPLPKAIRRLIETILTIRHSAHAYPSSS